MQKSGTSSLRRAHLSTTDSSFGESPNKPNPTKHINKKVKSDPLTADELNDIIQYKFDELKANIIGDFTDTQHAIVQSISERLIFIEHKVDKLEKAVIAVEAENLKLNANVNNLQQRMSLLEIEHNQLAQHSRKSYVKIWGMPDDGSG